MDPASGLCKARIMLVAGLVLMLIHCGEDPIMPTEMPNPASEHCAQQGGQLVIMDEAKGQVGFCHFNDGSVCEEWDLFRKNCGPGQCQTTCRNAGAPDEVLVDCNGRQVAAACN
ncbi:MAG: DUF333 domain-containing protein [Leptospiraceae bacterium]|nr:DUF333 domain-containing protein [Leptospiraceae bacterium]